MATSGVTGSLSYSLADLLDQSVLKTGWTWDQLTGAHVKIAQTEANLFLSSLVNRGINLWKIEDILIGLKVGQIQYPTPSGTIDILNLNYRTVSSVSGNGFAVSSAGGNATFAFDLNTDTSCIQVSPNGSLTYELEDAVQVCTFGYLPDGDATMDLVLEFSADGLAWNTAMAFGPQVMTDDIWFYQDLPVAYSGMFWRLRETGGGTISVREVVFGTSFTEIPVWRFNRDDYSNQPNKYFQGQPLNFYYDRKRDIPLIRTWPVSPDSFHLFSGFLTRQLEDVLDPEDTIDVPQRWVDYVMFALAERLILNGIGDPNRLAMVQGQVEKCLFNAEAEERDNATSSWSPNLSAYTRG